MSLLSKVDKFCSHFYTVPWCVPPWGWREFGCTVRCLLTQRIVDGDYHIELAEAVKDHLGMSYARAVNRGRTALELALRALEVENTDVVLPSYVCRAVLDAVVEAKAHPVFADVGCDLNVTAETIQAAITPNTKCVIVAHLFGKASPIDEIETMLKGTGIALIDDAAQSFGARCSGRLVGTFGVCGIVSCGPGKSLAGSAGGVLVTNDRELYERLTSVQLKHEAASTVIRRVLLFWLWRRFRRYTLPFQLLLERLWGAEQELPYVATTLSNLEAGIALQQLKALTLNSQQRRWNAHALLKNLGTLGDYCIADLTEASTILKLVVVLPPDGPTAAEVIDVFANTGIECQAGYTPLHLKTADKSIQLPVTEDLWDRVVCVPVDTGSMGIKRLLSHSGKWQSLPVSKRDRLQPSGSSVP